MQWHSDEEKEESQQVGPAAADNTQHGKQRDAEDVEVTGQKQVLQVGSNGLGKISKKERNQKKARHHGRKEEEARGAQGQGRLGQDRHRQHHREDTGTYQKKYQNHLLV